jgi:polyphosphate glucokinase
MTIRIGVDIGGSGVKAATVDLASGRLTIDRVRIPTPEDPDVDALLDVVAQVVTDIGADGPVGIAFPGVVKGGTTLTAANLTDEWIGVDASARFADRLERDVALLNDADAAGTAEVRYGAARDRAGVVLLVTIGTGLGTALFTDGVLVPNIELGHLDLDGTEAEDLASERARIEQDLSWKKWAGRLDHFLERMEAYLNPDLIVLGGGGAKEADHFLRHLHRRADVVVAALGNRAGIVGAAMAVE